jgi:WH2 motif
VNDCLTLLCFINIRRYRGLQLRRALSPTLIMSSELLKQIQAGKKLKKADTSDRSAPVIDSSNLKPSSSAPGVSAAGRSAAGGPPQLAGLFAGGMPKLKPAGQSNLGEQYRHMSLHDFNQV